MSRSDWAKANPDRVKAAKQKYRASPAAQQKEREYRKEYKKRPSVVRRTKEFMSSEKRLAWRREYARKKRSEDRIGYVLSKLKQRAKDRGLEMTLTELDIIIPERCPVLHMRLDWADRWAVPSVDRLDNSKGYIPGNVRVISRRANTLKSNATVSEIAGPCCLTCNEKVVHNTTPRRNRG